MTVERATSGEVTAPPPSVDCCANCGKRLRGEFCHQCGQARTAQRRITFASVSSEFLSRLLNLESSFTRTFVDLWVRPGVVARDYVRGRRKKYTNPVGYFLLVTTVAVLIEAMMPVAADTDLDMPIWMERFLTQVLLAVSLFLAVIWWWLFRRSGYNLAENLVFSLYILGHATWFELALMPLTPRVIGGDAMAALVWLTIGVYFVIAATVFYDEKWYRVSLKFLISLLIALAIFFVASLPFFIFSGLS